MKPAISELLHRVDSGRIEERLFNMVSIPSPTGNARVMAEYYADLLRHIGLQSELHPLDGFPDSPRVVARQLGSGRGPTLQLAGHLDTIHTEHAAPSIRDGCVYGRGTVDMKSGLAAMAEVVQILVESRLTLPGDILLTAYDLHEHPWGHREALFDLIDTGIVGEAVIVAEGPRDNVAIAAKATTSFEIEIRSPAGSPHELQVGPGMSNPFDAGIELGRRLIELRRELMSQDILLLGAESLFLSSIHGGDFYNRLPRRVTIGGTRRFDPDHSFEAVQEELRAIADQVVAGTELTATVTLGPMSEGFRQADDSRLIKSVRTAHRILYGREMPLVGQFFGADNVYFINRAGIPAVCMGVGLERAHADVEYVKTQAVGELTQRILLSILVFFELL
jgi:acetylornithine deacetylase/succinyl-diaminopimelate desuccinylase-like protein